MVRLALLLVVLLPFPVAADSVPRQIVVSAMGTAAAEPDMATLRFGVTRQADTAETAMTEVALAADAVLAVVRDAGIAPRDLQTSSLSLNPIWDQQNARPQGIRGYAASTNLIVRVRDLDTVGTLLDRVVGEGANQLNGLSFEVSDVEPLQDIARTNAVAHAKRKAETLAEAAGIGLGEVVTIQETNGFASPMPMMRGAMMETAAMPIATGEVDVSVTVTVTFAIAD